MVDGPNLDDVILELWTIRAEMAAAANREREVFLSDLRQNMRAKSVTCRRPMSEFTQRQIRLGEEILANAHKSSRDSNLEKL